MNETQTELWQRLTAFPLDETGASFPYSRKLARENDWSPAYTLRVIHEYRRFILLAMTAGHPVSPSDAVDQAWHMHLTYTRSYWQGLCRQVLGKPFHHEPSQGGANESAKFASWYVRTLSSYRTVFGEEPPSDIWPQAATAAPQRRRIDLERTWALSKPRHLAWTGAGVAVVMALLLSGGCTPTDGWGTSLFNLPGPAFLAAFLKIWIVCFAVALFLRLRHWRTPSSPLPPDDVSPDPYWHACLAGDSHRAAAVAVSTLASQGNIEVSSGAFTLHLERKNKPSPSTHPVAADLWEMLPPVGKLAFEKAVARAEQTCAPILADLETKSLLLTPSGRSRARWRPFLIALLPVAIGVVKVGVGLHRHKPVGFLVMLCLFATVLALVTFVRPVRLTRRGQRTLADLKTSYSDLKAPGANSTGLLPLGVALFGTGVLSVYGFPELEHSLRPLQTNYQGTDGGTGCGSSGGDGGGGGCGGCSGGGGD